MKNSLAFFAQKVYSQYGEPLREKTVLFIEAYNGAVHGDCEAILRHMLKDERFLDWKFIWTIPDSVSYEPTFDLDKRICFAAQNLYEFVIWCERASVIVTGTVLPDYYVKREGQVVLGCFHDGFFEEHKKINLNTVRIQTTLDKLDYLYADSPKVIRQMEQWYPSQLPCALLQGRALRLNLPASTNAEIVVSIKKGILGDRFSLYEAKYKECMYLCVPYRKQIYFRLDKALYRQFQEENEPVILAHTGSDEDSFVKAAKNAELVITDNALNALDTARMQIPCIYISASAVLPDYFSEDESKWISFAANWPEAAALLEDKLKTVQKSADDSDTYGELAEVADVLSGETKVQVPSVKQEQPSELWIVPGDIPGGFWEAMRYYKPCREVSILVRSTRDNMLWKQKYPLSNDKKLYCKLGFCPRNERGKLTKEILSNDWKRMAGNRCFDRVYAWEKADSLWNGLYQICPTEHLEKIGEKEIAAILFDNLVGRTEESAPHILEYEEVNGKKCCVLGRDGKQTYYLPLKGELKNITVLFVQRRDQIKQYCNLAKAQENEECTFILLDPCRFMETSAIREKENVYWIPKNIFPVALLSNAREVLGYTSKVLLCEGLKILKG